MIRLGKLLTLRLVTDYTSHTREVVSNTPVKVGQKVKYKNRVYIVERISENDYIM